MNRPVYYPAFFAGLLAADVFSIVLVGWCAHLAWSWHLVPLGLPTISALQAAGVALVFRILGGSSTMYKDHDVDAGLTYANQLAVPLIGLLMAYAIKVLQQ